MAVQFKAKRPDQYNIQTGNYGAAHGMTDLGAIFGTLQSKSPKFDAIGGRIIQRDAELDATQIQADALRDTAEIEAESIEKAAKLNAQGQKSVSDANRSAGVWGTIGKVAGIGLGLALSDETTKNTIRRIEYATETLSELRPVSFYYKEEYSTSPERLHYGFIAQEYKDVMPDATYYDESVGKMCIDTGELIALLVRSIQELESRVTRMEAEAALEKV